MENIYADIAARTGGNIYIGVVGPVRTGKSTMIKRIMETLVIPNIEDPYQKERAMDELPQSGSGRTIMTSEPKFVPEDAVSISPDGTVQLQVRMIDSVGYMVQGAVGVTEDGAPRMVTTPWVDHEIPLAEAAELGTKRVMEDHASVGIVVTTDGTVTDIPRSDYLEAEARAISDMQATGKPFLVVINSREPGGEGAKAVKEQIAGQYGIQPVIMDCQAMQLDDIRTLLLQLLYRFPMRKLEVQLPRWLDAVELDHPVKASVYEALLKLAGQIPSLAEAEDTLSAIAEVPNVDKLSMRRIDPGTGTVCCTVLFPEALFYEILSAKAGMPIADDGALLALLTELAAVKQEYDKLSGALEAVHSTGYGIVMPTAQDMQLQDPEPIRKGGAFGVKLKAAAPSIHMIRVDIDTEISPIVGDEKQSKELVEHLSSQTPQTLWQSNIFGKSVYEMIQEGLTAKLIKLPEEVRGKFRGSLTRIVNEGASGLICLIL